MKIIISLSVAIFCLAATTSVSAIEPTPGVGVWDAGQDGDEHFYDIRCPDHRQVVITGNRKAGKMCFFMNDGKEQCLRTEDIRMVAQRACMQTKPN